MDAGVGDVEAAQWKVKKETEDKEETRGQRRPVCGREKPYHGPEDWRTAFHRTGAGKPVRPTGTYRDSEG